MSTRKIVGIIIGISLPLLILMFVPTNAFFGIDSHNPESPSPIMVYENSDEMLMGLKIIPIGCDKTDSGLTESKFQISNTSDNNYELTIGISFTDNDSVLYEKEIHVLILSGQTVSKTHQSNGTYDNPVCVVQINDWYET